ncbi:hypothetical protein DOTSEDRAFT_44416 [Dothistroma septosporum NZE10]|uniref:Uncharacterized protein n=1 Tax=Dothistroma septosporum (strain NZE10 / CBS 128990) TaxID=675120 RepID=N1PKY2_DOTSN|nr:hypothetical protein DOTSEDRAFT_44416 [Dothistroma septosporum NZE10]
MSSLSIPFFGPGARTVRPESAVRGAHLLCRARIPSDVLPHRSTLTVTTRWPNASSAGAVEWLKIGRGHIRASGLPVEDISSLAWIRGDSELKFDAAKSGLRVSATSSQLVMSPPNTLQLHAIAHWDRRETGGERTMSHQVTPRPVRSAKLSAQGRAALPMSNAPANVEAVASHFC